MTSSFTSLEDYLKHLHLFGETFGLHTKTSTSVIKEIPQAFERLEQVYSFDKKCVDAVMSLISTTAVTVSAGVAPWRVRPHSASTHLAIKCFKIIFLIYRRREKDNIVSTMKQNMFISRSLIH